MERLQVLKKFWNDGGFKFGDRTKSSAKEGGTTGPRKRPFNSLVKWRVSTNQETIYVNILVSMDSRDEIVYTLAYVISTK